MAYHTTETFQNITDKNKKKFVRMEVIKKESEKSLKYHMFKRLNTGWGITFRSRNS